MNTKLLSHVWRVLIVLVFSLSLAGVPVMPVSATGVHLYVATSGSDAGPNDCLTESSPCLTVAHAISQATNDDIIHIAAGTYVENLTVDKSLSFLGAGMNQTILDGNGNGKVVNVNAAVNVSLTDLTIQNGYNITSWGGGIYIWGGSLSLTDVKVTNNTGQWGGGISSSAPVSMDDCVISGNTAMSGGGGGIYSNATSVSITDSTISGNGATATDTDGGGLFIDGSVLSLTGLTISGNDANGSGGGIHVQGTNTKNLTNVTISGNTAYEGGGIFNSSIDTIDIINSTIANNISNSGSGIKNYGSIRFLNTIVANNAGSEDCINFPTGTTWTSLGYNLGSGSSCAFTQTGDMQNTDPQLGSLSDNGGLTQTHALPSGSPAVDAGTNSDCPATDQRGVTRPYPVGGTCDIGAYELTNNPPTDISLSNNTIAENQFAGTTVGMLSTTDADSGDTHTYSFCGGTDDASFQINADSLQTNAVFDYETKTTYEVCIQTDDGNGGIFSKNFTIYVTDVPETITATIRSTGAQDGWLIESGENTNIGGNMNSTFTTLRLGDDAARKQYRSLLSFATGNPLPDNAVITKVMLKVKKQGVLGVGDPVTIFQGFFVDIRKGTFGTVALQIDDWHTVAQKTIGPSKPPLVVGWYTFNLTGAKDYINKLATLSGVTQIRLRFKLDDNNNSVANTLSLYSGNYTIVASRPTLVIEYYVP